MEQTISDFDLCPFWTHSLSAKCRKYEVKQVRRAKCCSLDVRAKSAIRLLAPSKMTFMRLFWLRISWQMEVHLKLGHKCKFADEERTEWRILGSWIEVH